MRVGIRGTTIVGQTGPRRGEVGPWLPPEVAQLPPSTSVGVGQLPSGASASAKTNPEVGVAKLELHIAEWMNNSGLLDIDCPIVLRGVSLRKPEEAEATDVRPHQWHRHRQHRTGTRSEHEIASTSTTRARTRPTTTRSSTMARLGREMGREPEPGFKFRSRFSGCDLVWRMFCLRLPPFSSLGSWTLRPRIKIKNFRAQPSWIESSN